MNAVNLDPEAAGFRDISKSDQRNELLIRIGLVIAFVLVLVGTIVGICHFKNAPLEYHFEGWNYSGAGNYYRWGDYGWGYYRVVDPSRMAILPGLFGTVGMIGIVATFIFFHNMERVKNGEEHDDLTLEQYRADRLFQLQTQSFENFYGQYYENNGGLGPFVRSGLITVSEGKELRALFKKYTQANKVVSTWTLDPKLSPNFVEDVKEHSTKYRAYQEAQDTIATVKQNWETFQSKLISNS